MYNKNNPFSKYLNDKIPQMLRDIDLLRRLVMLVEGEFEYRNINTDEILDIVQGMLRERKIEYEEVKELLEEMRKRNE